MDAQGVDALISGEPSIWDRWPRAMKELVRRLLVFFGPVGTFDYRTGVAGEVDLPDGARVVSIAFEGGSLTINGGAPIIGDFEIDPTGVLQDPTLVFTDTTKWFVEFVVEG